MANQPKFLKKKISIPEGIVRIALVVVSAALVTLWSWFYMPHRDCFSRGLPFAFWQECYPEWSTGTEIHWMPGFVIADFLFWVVIWLGLWWLIKKMKTEKAKFIMKVVVLAGGLMSIVSYFLPLGGVEEYTCLFVRYFEIQHENLRDILIIFFFLQPHLFFGTIVIGAAYSGFKKGIYWLSMIMSAWVPITTLETLYQVVIPVAIVFTGKVHIFSLVDYTQILGPIITYIGLILYKLVDEK